MSLFTSQKTFAKYAWFTLAYNIFVVLLGAFVRATGSGAGCGGHWPLCNGEVIPQAPALETIIEFTHRMSSGLSAVFVALLLIAAWRIYPKGSLMRWGAILSFVFILTEALFGAGLVLFGLVQDNDSVARAVAIVLHLCNTFLLLGFLALTARWATLGFSPQTKFNRPFGILLLVGVVLMIVLGASGAITALGDTLFPSTSLAAGMQQDFSPTANFLLRLRVFHPVIAVSVGVYLSVLAFFIRQRSSHPKLHRATNWLEGLIGLQILLGLTNLILLAPIWMQLIHLAVTDLIWVSLVLLAELWIGGRVSLEDRADHTIHEGINQPAS